MGNLWILVALMCAFALATSDAFTKRALSLHNEYLIAWLRLLLSLPALVVTFVFIDVPPLDGYFFGAFLSSLPLEVVAIILYIKALKVSPLSLTLPFLSLTPVFLIAIPYVILGEEVSIPGAAGIVLIAAGSYVLNIREFGKGILEPFAAIRREKGSLFMICVAFIYAITSSLGKMSIEHSSPLFFGISYYIVLVIIFTPVAIYKGREEITGVFRSGALRAAIVPGILYSGMIVSHVIALSLTKVAYMIAVKRLSLLIGVIYGHIFFGESGIKRRMLGTALMVTGFILLTVFR